MTSSYNPMSFGMERYGGTNPANIITRSVPKQVAQQGGKTILRQGGQTLGRYGGPLINLGLGGMEVYDAARTGRDPRRQALKTLVEMGAGSLSAAGASSATALTPAAPAAPYVGMAAYGAGSYGAGQAFDALYPEPFKDDTVYGRKPGTFKVVDGKPQFVPGQDVVGPVPQPRTGKGGFVVVPKSEGGGIRFDPNFDQSSVYKLASTIVPPINFNQNLPASAEQSMDKNPIEYGMARYEQGRGAASTQAERNQVRDLGLAIHKAHNPHLYSDFRPPLASNKTFNPQMTGLQTSMFPEGYPQTKEAFIKEGGVQMPFTMTDKDARNEVIAGNKKQGLAQLAEATQMLEEQAFMQEFIKDLGKKKK